MNKSEELIACLEGEIAKRDARIVELESGQSADMFLTLTGEITQLRAELAAIKAQEPVAWAGVIEDCASLFVTEPQLWKAIPLYAAPVSEAKAQGEYGDAYQGAREDLAIWKRRALEAEEKVLQQEQIIDHLTSEAQGESRFGEPVVTPDAPCVPDGYVLADKKALGTVLQALVNAPHHIRELQVTRQPVELFSDNPINVLIANYEAPAAPVQQPKCRTCDDNGRIGGPSFYAPDEGGEPCPDCCAPVQQVSVPASAFASRAITHYEAALLAAFPSGSSGEVFNQWNEARRVLAADPAVPAADGWISASERLPGEDDQVLCWCEDETVAWAEVSSHHNSFFTDMTHELLPVTHWMPLPAAPIKIEASRHDQ